MGNNCCTKHEDTTQDLYMTKDPYMSKGTLKRTNTLTIDEKKPIDESIKSLASIFSILQSEESIKSAEPEKEKMPDDFEANLKKIEEKGKDFNLKPLAEFLEIKLSHRSTTFDLNVEAKL